MPNTIMNSPAIPMKAVLVKIVPEISSSAPNKAGTRMHIRFIVPNVLFVMCRLV